MIQAFSLVISLIIFALLWVLPVSRVSLSEAPSASSATHAKRQLIASSIAQPDTLPLRWDGGYVSANRVLDREMFIKSLDTTADDLPADAFFDAPVKPVTYAVPAEATKLDHYMSAVSKSFDKRIRYALAGVDNMPSRLLAIKYYLPRQASINACWVWTRKQVDQYKRSAEYRQALAQVGQIRTTFAEQNPGYTLHVDTEVRSLADQVAIWNAAPSVEASGRKLYQDAIKTLADTTFADAPDVEGLGRFRTFLLSSKVPAVPTAAVPGFSQHGQLRAFDFIIWAGDTSLVAGSDAGAAYLLWDKSGWSDKLNTAVRTASSNFEGPLAAPHEPWHYAYSPSKKTKASPTPMIAQKR